MKAVWLALALTVAPVSGQTVPASPTASVVAEKAEASEHKGGFPWVTFVILFVVFGGLTMFRKKDQSSSDVTDKDKAS
ncbi:hypothetical protein [Asticcacaulis excentricus]|uniref:Uncharacterized protein n=1 Tax=Asticcacaulis excentricus (strain ATCC 15261 / DSM 4724 / KCTC 12464 / NCIMB 9791 / VKM B-1370 / CB 48) TaxID=573065 RepID=E8RSK4_ASTEC|nr:hypothetical protein [Asticcacaulis excentricus]ADU14475.1 hypothetical protein Astex_2837 [Asticcacaulis excentricus CB 48]